MSKLDSIMKKINKDFGINMITKGPQDLSIAKIPFSSPTANFMTYGGIPVGKVTEFYGGDGGGKTTSALDICANAQKLYLSEWEEELRGIEEDINKCGNSKADQKKKKKLEDELNEVKEEGPRAVVYVDLEHTLDIEWAKKLNVDTDKLILVSPENQSAEEIFDIMLELIDSGSVGLMVLDSIPCLVPQQVVDESFEKKSYGGVAGALTQFANRLPPHITDNEVAFIGINQVREDLSNAYSTVVTPGGKAWKHLCSLRIRYKKGRLLDIKGNEVPNGTENPAGNLVQMEISKTKVCRPDRRLGYYTLNYIDGIDLAADVLTMALKYKFIIQSGAWYNFMDPQTGEIKQFADGTEIKFQGKSKVLDFMREESCVIDELLERLIPIIEEG